MSAASGSGYGMSAKARRRWTLAAQALVVVGAASALPCAGQSPAQARALYVLHCAGCHSMDGSGVPDKGVPSMRGTLGRYLQLPEGRAFLVQVPGVLNAGLSDPQIAAVTNWALAEFSAETLPKSWPPYTAQEVAQARLSRPLDVARARAELWRRLEGAASSGQ